MSNPLKYAIRVFEDVSTKPISSIGTFTSLDGIGLIAGSSDKNIRFLDVDTLEEIKKSKVNKKSVSFVAISQMGFDGEDPIIVTGGKDSSVQIWDPEDGSVSREINLPTKEVRSLAVYQGSESLLVVGTKDAKVFVWDLKRNNKVALFEGHRASVHCVNITSSVTDFETQNDMDYICIVSGGADRTVRSWDLVTGKKRKKFRHARSIATMSVAYKGIRPILATGGVDRAVNLWDIETAVLLRRLEGHLDQINSLALWEGYQTLIVTASNDHTIRVFDILTGENVCILLGHKDSVLSLTIADNEDPKIVSCSEDLSLIQWSLTDIIEDFFYCDGDHLGARNITPAYLPKVDYVAPPELDKSLLTKEQRKQIRKEKKRSKRKYRGKSIDELLLSSIENDILSQEKANNAQQSNNDHTTLFYDSGDNEDDDEEETFLRTAKPSDDYTNEDLIQPNDSNESNANKNQNSYNDAEGDTIMHIQDPNRRSYVNINEDMVAEHYTQKVSIDSVDDRTELRPSTETTRLQSLSEGDQLSSSFSRSLSFMSNKVMPIDGVEATVENNSISRKSSFSNLIGRIFSRNHSASNNVSVYENNNDKTKELGASLTEVQMSDSKRQNIKASDQRIPSATTNETETVSDSISEQKLHNLIEDATAEQTQLLHSYVNNTNNSMNGLTSSSLHSSPSIKSKAYNNASNARAVVDATQQRYNIAVLDQELAKDREKQRAADKLAQRLNLLKADESSDNGNKTTINSNHSSNSLDEKALLLAEKAEKLKKHRLHESRRMQSMERAKERSTQALQKRLEELALTTVNDPILNNTIDEGHDSEESDD
eukprot:gene7441-10139_t